MGYSQTQKNVRRGKRRLYNINDTDWTNPVAAARCDGCTQIVRHSDLVEQKEYRGGMVPVPTGRWVCPSCLDVPQPFFQLQVLAPDPRPVKNPRPDTMPSFALLITQTEEPLLTTIDLDELEWT